MTVLADSSERFQLAVRDMRITVRDNVWRDPSDPERVQIMSGKTLHVTWEEPYGTGWTTKHLDLPVGRVTDTLFGDPETAEVVLTTAAAHLIGLLRGAS